jgi:hypothetical protein
MKSEIGQHLTCCRMIGMEEAIHEDDVSRAHADVDIMRSAPPRGLRLESSLVRISHNSQRFLRVERLHPPGFFGRRRCRRRMRGALRNQ